MAYDDCIVSADIGALKARNEKKHYPAYEILVSWNKDSHFTNYNPNETVSTIPCPCMDDPNNYGTSQCSIGLRLSECTYNPRAWFQTRYVRYGLIPPDLYSSLGIWIESTPSRAGIICFVACWQGRCFNRSVETIFLQVMKTLSIFPC